MTILINQYIKIQYFKSSRNYRVSQKGNLSYGKPFPAKFCLVIGNLYSHVCTKFGEFMLKFHELGVHFSQVPPFLLFQILSTADRFLTLTEK